MDPAGLEFETEANDTAPRDYLDVDSPILADHDARECGRLAPEGDRCLAVEPEVGPEIGDTLCGSAAKG
jgi:hypothetical protein